MEKPVSSICPGNYSSNISWLQKPRAPDLFVAMAAYGDYGMGYIGSAHAYAEGGYETSENASKVSPEVESVLMDAIHRLLDVSEK